MEITQSESESCTYHSQTNPEILDNIAERISGEFPSPSPNLKLVVTIPANNEERNIAHCLKAMAGQYASANVRIEYGSYEVIVLCHNCIDNTVRVIKEIQGNYPFLKLFYLEVNVPEVNNVGAVRRVLMHIAAQRLPSDSGYIATTDADTLADRYWIANLLGYLNSGYGLICGRIDIDFHTVSGIAKVTLEYKQRYFALRTRLEHLISPDLTNPWPRHAHNSGPNLAVRRDVYLDIGGMPPKGFLEDIALYDAICAAGYKIRHCPCTIVTTSCRLTPRAPWGFGSELKDWSEADHIFFKVEGLERLLAKFRIFESIRSYYRKPSKVIIDRLSRVTGLSTKTIREGFDQFKGARPMINKMDRHLDGLEGWQLKYPMKLVSLAVAELEDYLQNAYVDLSHI